MNVGSDARRVSPAQKSIRPGTPLADGRAMKPPAAEDNPVSCRKGDWVAGTA